MLSGPVTRAREQLYHWCMQTITSKLYDLGQVFAFTVVEPSPATLQYGYHARTRNQTNFSFNTYIEMQILFTHKDRGFRGSVNCPGHTSSQYNGLYCLTLMLLYLSQVL